MGHHLRRRGPSSRCHSANPLAPYLTKISPDYTDALQSLSFLMVIVWPLALFVIRDRPEDMGQLPDGAESAAEIEAEKPADLPLEREQKSFGELGRIKAFWLLLFGSAFSIGSIAAVNFLMKFVFEEQGFTEQAARDRIWADASATYLMSSIMGRLMAGWLADHLPRKYVMLATYAIVAMAIPLLFMVTPAQPNMVYLFAIVFGFAMGADYMLIPLMAADQFGLRSLGKAMSAIAERHDPAVLDSAPDCGPGRPDRRLRPGAVGRVRTGRPRGRGNRVAPAQPQGVAVGWTGCW